MDSNGVPKKIYRHILKAVAYYNRDCDTGANFDDIVQYVTILNKNLVPVKNLGHNVSIALNNIYNAGLIDVDENDQNFHLSYNKMQAKRLPKKNWHRKKLQNNGARATVDNTIKGQRKVKRIKNDNESSESHIGSNETITSDTKDITMDEEVTVVTKKRNKIRNRRPTPYNSKENLSADKNNEDDSMDGDKVATKEEHTDNHNNDEDKTAIKKEDPDKKPENDNKLPN